MTAKETAALAIQRLESKFSERESLQLVKILLEDLFGITSLHSEQVLADPLAFDSAIKQLLADKPIQYITGIADFYGHKFFINEHALIPRPETEELVRWILEDYGSYNVLLDLIDIGLGSGCIAITLAKHQKRIRATGVEVSMDTMNVARINSRRHQVQMSFALLDIRDHDYWSALGQYDIIVSNPPYVLIDDLEIMGDSVKAHEPELALYAGEDPLLFYKEIKVFSKSHLKKGGSIYVEIHEAMGEEVVALFSEEGNTVDLRKDMQGKDRMVRIKWLGVSKLIDTPYLPPLEGIGEP